jgi:hypothetical protein
MKTNGLPKLLINYKTHGPSDYKYRRLLEYDAVNSLPYDNMQYVICRVDEVREITDPQIK